MAITDNKITTADLTGKGVSSLTENQFVAEADMLKAKFDSISKDVIIPKFNDSLDAIQAVTNSLNPTSVQAQDGSSRYIKFPDGTMICAMAISGGTLSSTSSLNGLYYAPVQTFTFPLAFVGIAPFIVVSGYSTETKLLPTVYDATTANCRIMWMGGAAYTNQKCYGRLIAIGRWK